MAFYTDKCIIMKNNEKDIRLFRKDKEEITVDDIVGLIEENNKKTLCKDSFREYDIDIDSKSNIYLIYQNIEMHLVLIVIKPENTETIKLTNTPIGEVFYLNILIENDIINIIYVIGKKDNIYEIYHHYYKDSKWITFMVEEINVNKILNPIKVISYKGKITLTYIDYKEIMLKEFDLNKLKWELSHKLIGTTRDKIFLDMIRKDDIYHIIYCEFRNDNLVVKYKSYTIENKGFILNIEEDLSGEGSPSYPSLIFYKDKIWAQWLELNKINSRSANKIGENWGPLDLWEHTIKKDIVRYKYIEREKEEGIILHYCFGKVYPEVQFVGFGGINI